jgi:thiol-disulfide isomerase/thioredoxin
MSVEEFHMLLTQLEGSPVVVNVWASWCGPCKTEAPMLAAAATEHPGVQFIGIDAEDSRDGAERFIDSYGVPFPSVFDPDGAIQTDLEVIGPPMTVFFDADGNEVARAAGELSQDTLDEHLAAISE